MPATLPAPVKAAAAKATLNFDWLVPHRNFFSLAQTAGMLGVSESFVEKLFDAGKELSGHEYNGGAGVRMTKRIPRTFVIALLVRSAKYDAETKRDAILSCLREFTGAELLAIAEQARRMATEKGSR